MILGVDVSTYLEEIEKGAKYYDNGVLINPLKDLHDNGVDCMRIRLWNNPYDEKGVPYLAGTCDLDNFLKLSHLAKSLGYGILLDFHYSDFWADPGKQMIPKAWASFGIDEMEEAVYAFTKTCLQKACAEDVVAEKALFFRLLDGDFKTVNGDRIFCTNVDITFVSTDGITGDSHCFENNMGVTFEN